MLKIPKGENLDPETRKRYHFGVALALGMILSTTLLFLLEYAGLTNLLPNWP